MMALIDELFAKRCSCSIQDFESKMTPVSSMTPGVPAGPSDAAGSAGEAGSAQYASLRALTDYLWEDCCKLGR
jgi:hypothetical protein